MNILKGVSNDNIWSCHFWLYNCLTNPYQRMINDSTSTCLAGTLLRPTELTKNFRKEV